MTTHETAWIYSQEQPDDILRTGKMKREAKVISNRDTVIAKVGKECHEENEAYLKKKYAVNENLSSNKQ